MWLVVRSRSPWLAAIANAVVLLINLNVSTSNRTLVFLVIFLFATLLLVVRFALAEHMRVWHARGLRFSPDIGWDFMQAGAVFSLIVLLLANMLPVARANDTFLTYWNSSQSPWQAVQNAWATVFNGVNGNAGAFGELGVFGSDLQLQGTVHLPDSVILRYKVPATNDDPTQYLVSQTFDTYNGSNAWTMSAANVLRYDAGASQPPSADPSAVQPDTYNVTFAAVPANNHLFAPGSEAQSFNVPSDAYVSSMGGVSTQWESLVNLSTGVQYSSTGYVSSATEDQLRKVPYPAAAPVKYPQGIVYEYIDSTSPEQITPYVLATARQATAGTTNMYDAALALQTTCTRSNTASRIRIHRLVRMRLRGFCTGAKDSARFRLRHGNHGSRARHATRVAVGFTNGTLDSSTGTYVVKGTMAHAWTQVYFADYGWINFEPTSTFGAFTRQTSPYSSAQPTPASTANAHGTPTPRGQRQRDPGLSTLAPGGNGSGGQVFLVDAGLSLSMILLLLLALTSLFLLWWRRLYRGLSPVAMALHETTRLGTWAGAPPTAAQTPLEYAETLSAVVPGRLRALTTLAELYSAERWGGPCQTSQTSKLHSFIPN